MTKQNFETLKSYFVVLSARMKEREEDCANPKTAVDKGYSLAVNHMNMEIDRMLSDLENQVWSKPATNFEYKVPPTREESNTSREENIKRNLFAFNASQLVIHISNSKEYLEFMELLDKHGIEIPNPSDYGMDKYDYDPAYPYFYIDAICDGMMNANRQYENIKEHYGISEVVEFSKLGEILHFTKEDEQIEYEER